MAGIDFGVDEGFRDGCFHDAFISCLLVVLMILPGLVSCVGVHFYTFECYLSCQVRMFAFYKMCLCDVYMTEMIRK